MSEHHVGLQISLAGRVALVTGSTRGIGRAIAETLARAGARVAVTGRDAARAEEAARAIADAYGVEVRGYGVEVSDVAQGRRAVSSR